MENAGPRGTGRKRAVSGPPDKNHGCGEPQAARPKPGGTAESRRPARRPRAGPGAPRPVPNTPTADDGFGAVQSLLIGYECLCRGNERSGPVGEDGPADRAAALRKDIGDLLARSESGSKVARFLRGMRVLVEAERITPGVLAVRRREARGWLTPLSFAEGSPGRQAAGRVAVEDGVDPVVVKEELRFAEAVEVIVRNSGVGAGQLLTPGGRLGEGVVLRVARKGPERQRYAIREAAENRAPLDRPAPGIWPMDTRDYAKVPGRLGRASGAVDRVIAALPGLTAGPRFAPEVEAKIRRHAAGVVAASRRLLGLFAEPGPAARDDTRSVAAGRALPRDMPRAREPARPMTWAQVRGALDAAHYFTEKTLHDVPRLPPELRPTRGQATKIRGQLQSLICRTPEVGRLLAGRGQATV